MCVECEIFCSFMDLPLVLVYGPQNARLTGWDSVVNDDDDDYGWTFG